MHTGDLPLTKSTDNKAIITDSKMILFRRWIEREVGLTNASVLLPNLGGSFIEGCKITELSDLPNDKNTKKILTTFEPHDTIIEINDFIMGRLKYDDNFKNLTFSDVGYSVLQLDFYNRYVNTPSAVNKEFFINENNEAELRVIKNNSNDNSQMCYSSQLFKRYYSEDAVKKIYNEDYINFNLKNILKSGFLKAEFIPIKDLKIRSHLLYRPWGHFFSDPYLFDYDDDKILRFMKERLIDKNIFREGL